VILDYKTDALHSGSAEDLAAKAEHYRPQLDAYRAAVAAGYALPLEMVTARLVFLDAAAVVEL
jgi:ATP-dependent exoDNAse (exonuclease V) beta subunit